MRKTLLLILFFLSLVALFLRFATAPLVEVLGLKERAGVRIEANQKSEVSINNKVVGETPYQDENLTEGEYLIALKRKDASSSAESSWQGYVKLNGGTLSVVNRELAPNPSNASGETITLEKGKGVTIVSTPPNAEVSIDGQVAGRTPISISSISSGEHQFLISKENYLKRSIRATLVDDFNLNLAVDLALSEADLTQIPSPPITENKEVVVKQTPVGFLRVRNNPTTSSQEVARVKPGDTLILLEELDSWMRIKTQDGKEGYVSSSYVEKK